jgi:hypothetical protein
VRLAAEKERKGFLTDRHAVKETDVFLTDGIGVWVAAYGEPSTALAHDRGDKKITPASRPGLMFRIIHKSFLYIP